MNRRNFFKKTLLTLGASWLAFMQERPAEAAIGKIPLFSCWVAGFQYHQGMELIHRLRPGDILILRREPDNPHDDKAIAVLAGNTRLGYIPRAVNSVPAAHLDEGRPLSACVLAADADAPPWRMVEVLVEMETGGGPGRCRA